MALFKQIIGNPIQTIIAVIAATIVVTVFESRRTNKRKDEFEAVFGFRPEDTHEEALKNLVRMVLDAAWPVVHLTETEQKEAYNRFNTGRTPELILAARVDYDKASDEYRHACHEFGLKMKLAIRFSYLDLGDIEIRNSNIGSFAKDHSYYATA